MANSAYRFSLASDNVAGMAKILQTLESKEHALKAGELAKLLGVTRQHIYKMAAASAIPSFRIGAAVRFDPKQVAEWLTRRMPQAAPIKPGQTCGMTMADLVGIQPTTLPRHLCLPRQLCDDLLHKLPVGVGFSKIPHILEVSRAQQNALLST